MENQRLALYTFGMFRERADHPANQGFHDRNDANLEAAEASDGFIARSGYDGEPGPETWGVQVFPRFYAERDDGWAPSTLSLWRDLESAMAFTYGGIHGEALRHGREWFVKPAWPSYVLWWAAAGHTPAWEAAVARHQYLHDHGPSPCAFDFKHPFDGAGKPDVIDRTLVRHKQAINSQRPAAPVP